MESIRRLREEENYQNWDCRLKWHREGRSVEGVLMNHVLEHLDCQEALLTLKEAYRVLLPGGVLRVGVPDASVFRRNFPEDCVENVQRLFGSGEALDPNGPKKTFMDGALFFKEHRQVFTEDSLWCHLANAGFRQIWRRDFGDTGLHPLAALDNRRLFTLFMEAVK
jgi:hypothetical protein